MKPRSWLMTGGALLAASFAAATAHAQSGGAPTAAPSNILEELVVTAERRAANLQDVPVAITAFSAHQRAIQGITTLQDITNYTPGLTYSTQLDRPVIRGLARNNNVYLSDSAVAVYNDDVFSQTTFLANRDDLFTEQVEVLLGPQGTLYGRNAIGGLINNKSRRPTEDLTAEVRAAVQTYGYTKIEGTVSGPVGRIDGLTYRLGGYWLRQRDGYLTNLTGPSEGDVHNDPYGELQLQYKGEQNELWLLGNVYGFNKDRGGPGALLGTPSTGSYSTALVNTGQIFFNPNFPFGGGAVPGSVVGIPSGMTNNPAQTDRRTFAHSIPTNVNVNAAYDVNFHFTHHFDGWDAKYIAGYSQYHYHLQISSQTNGNSPVTQYQIPCVTAGCTPLTVFPSQGFKYETHTEWFSHELNFTSTTNGPVQWIAGLFYYNERDDNPETFTAQQQAQLVSPVQVLPLLSAGQILPDLPNPNHLIDLLDYQAKITSAAAYGQVDWKASDTIKLTAGLRYTDDKKTGTEEARFVGFEPLSAAFSPQMLGNRLPAVDLSPRVISFAPAKGVTCAPHQATSGAFEGDWIRCLGDRSHAVTGTAAISWTPEADTLVFARYNRGYKAFGLNAGFIAPVPEASPEYVDDIELGVKKTFAHRLVLDANVFYYDYQDAQVPVIVPQGGVNVNTFYNIPKSTAEGLELTALWSPVNDLNLSLVYGFNKTEIRSGCSLVGGVATGACFADANDPPGLNHGAQVVAVTGGVAVQSVKGAPLPQAPQNKVAFNANYTFRFEPGNLTLSASYIWKDVSYSTIFQRDYNKAPAWNQVDLRATWSGDKDRYEVVAYVKNLFDTLGYDAAATGYAIAQPVGGGALAQAHAYDITPPRLVGLELHYRFF